MGSQPFTLTEAQMMELAEAILPSNFVKFIAERLNFAFETQITVDRHRYNLTANNMYYSGEHFD
jgi:hypothetical protein